VLFLFTSQKSNDMANDKRGGGVLVLVSVLVLGVLTFMYAGRGYVQSLAGITRCEETVAARFPSPAKLQSVVVWQRNCGKGTEVVTHVTLNTTATLTTPDAMGLIREGEVFLEVGKRGVNVSWTGEREVKLEVSGTGPIPGAPKKTRGDMQVHIYRVP
jgi:hypothetical protein